MVKDVIETLALNYSLPQVDGARVKTLQDFGNDLLEKICARHIDSDRGQRIEELYKKADDLQGRLRVKETELAWETEALAKERATNLRYFTALKLIQDHHPRCECMDSGGIAKEALEGK